jgi:hypothetical protein
MAKRSYKKQQPQPTTVIRPEVVGLTLLAMAATLLSLLSVSRARH